MNHPLHCTWSHWTNCNAYCTHTVLLLWIHHPAPSLQLKTVPNKHIIYKCLSNLCKKLWCLGFNVFMGYIEKYIKSRILPSLILWHVSVSPLVTVNLPIHLQCLDVPILDDKQCENAYPGMISPRMMCAGHMEGGKSPCNVSFLVNYTP